MKNNTITNYYTQNAQYNPRLDTDKFFLMPENQYSYVGLTHDLISFIEEFQLLNEQMWDYFIAEFADPNDHTNGGWRGEYWGKTMRGACVVYQYTQNEALYAQLEKAMIGLLETQDEFGRISTYAKDEEFRCWDMWSRKYVLLGSLHFIDICKNDALKAKITDAMKSHLDYILSKIGEGKMNISDTSNIWGSVNSCSILEPVMRFYNLTKEQKYLDFATYILDHFSVDGINMFDLAIEDKLLPYQYPVTKAYEMMSCFEGALEYYRVTKNEKYLTAAVNYGKRVAESDVTIIGCCGCTHELFDNSTLNQTLTTYTGLMQETCVTVTWMKLCTHLLSLTGDSMFADEIEKAMYNALYGSVNTYERPENGGLPFDSYSPLRKNIRARGIGGLQKVRDGYFYGCCACIGSVALGLIPQISIMHKEDGFVQNLFIPGFVSAKTPAGKEISVHCNTCYPAASRVELTIGLTESETFDYMLRIPAYSKTTFVTVNGEAVSVNTENGFLHINREWNNSDTIVLHLDFSLNVIHALDNPADENAKYHVAFTVGPVVLARDARVSDDVGEAITLDESKLRLTPAVFADFGTICQYELSLNETDTIRLIDYQSAGKTWNKESEMECWIPTKKF